MKKLQSVFENVDENGNRPVALGFVEYGADSLRFSLLQGVAPGNDTRYSDTKVESCRNFMNKIWNASRFVIMNCEGRKVKPVSEVKLLPADKWIIAKLQAAIRDVTLAMNKFELGYAVAQRLGHFSALFVADKSVKQNVAEGHLAHVL